MTHLCVFFLLLPTTGTVSALSRSPLGRANTFSFLSDTLAPRLSASVPPLSPCLLTLAFPLLLSFLLLVSLVPRKLLHGQCLCLVSSYILPYFLDYATPPYSSSPFCYFLPYPPINYGCQPLYLFFWHIPCFLLPFQLSLVSICSMWVRSQFCFLMLYYSSYSSILALFSLLSSVLLFTAVFTKLRAPFPRVSCIF